MFPDKKGHYISVFRELLNDYLEAAPSGKEIGSQILVQIDKKRIYNALKLTQKLIGHEIEVFKRMNEDIESEYELQSVKEAD